MQSESIKNLACALCTFQSELKPAEKNGYNPHFKSNFATLADVSNAVKDLLVKNGLSYVQIGEDPQSPTPSLVTVLMHTSGEWISGAVRVVPAKPADPQSLVAAMSYARRSALSAMLGVVVEDDDGNAAAANPSTIGNKTPFITVDPPRDNQGAQVGNQQRSLAPQLEPGMQRVADILDAVPVTDIDLGETTISFGKHRGKRFKDMPIIGRDGLRGYVDYLDRSPDKSNMTLAFIEKARAYMAENDKNEVPF